MESGGLRGMSVVFDLDGTLVDSAPDIFRATNRALTEAGYAAVEAAIMRPAVGYGGRAILKCALEEQGVTAEADLLARLESDLRREYLANIAVDSVPFPGVLDALETLLRHGAVLSVCTNKTTEMATHLLGALDMARHFGAVCGRDAFAFHKPHPGHLTATIAAAKGDASRAVMVGDSEADVEAARAAGLPAVVMSYGYVAGDAHDLGADLVLDRMDDLPAALGGLVNGVWSAPQA